MGKLVVYDTQFGNTKKISEAIALGIKGKVMNVQDLNEPNFTKVSLLIIGSPTYGGRAKPSLQAFLNKIPSDGLKGIKVASFDTRFGDKKN